MLCLIDKRLPSLSFSPILECCSGTHSKLIAFIGMSKLADKQEN
jgi:hypothetical protein